MSSTHQATTPWVKNKKFDNEQRLILAIIAQSVADLSNDLKDKKLKPLKVINSRGEEKFYERGTHTEDRDTAKKFISSDLFEKSCAFIGLGNYVGAIRRKTLSPDFVINPQTVMSCI